MPGQAEAPPVSIRRRSKLRLAVRNGSRQRQDIGRWFRGGSRSPCLFVWISFRSIVEVEIGTDDLKTHYDLIVVGTGPAGLTLARKYEERTGGKVLVIESGQRSRENNAAQKLSTVSATGDLPSAHYHLHNQRIFGGTSTVWNGWCAVLEKRSFLNNEWPFSYDELYAYYPDAAEILEVPEAVHTRAEVAFPGNANIVYRPYYFSPPVRFNELFEGWVNNNTNVDVLFNHSVMNINVKDATAASVIMRESTEGKPTPFEVAGSRIVLATGGIQNARLLELSLPWENKHLGAYYCEHAYPSYNSLSIILDREILEKVIDRKTSRIVHAISLSSEFLLKHKMNSAAFSIREEFTNVSSGRFSKRRLLGHSKDSITGNVVIHAEMSSIESNQVTLSNTHKDYLGQPIAQVNLRFNPEEIRAVTELLNVELVRSGIGRMSILPKEFHIGGGGHMMGTTRMGDNPDTSVTDAQGRVHGVENLYVAGSSLFPAVEAANPTLTIVALSLRLAHHLAGSG